MKLSFRHQSLKKTESCVLWSEPELRIWHHSSSVNFRRINRKNSPISSSRLLSCNGITSVPTAPKTQAFCLQSHPYTQAGFWATFSACRGRQNAEWVFGLSFEFFTWVLGFSEKPKTFSLSFLDCSSIIYWENSYRLWHFSLEFNFSIVFFDKNAIKSDTHSKILSFNGKIHLFSWVFLIGGKILPEVEFFPWVLVFSAGGVTKKAYYVLTQHTSCWCENQAKYKHRQMIASEGPKDPDGIFLAVDHVEQSEQIVEIRSLKTSKILEFRKKKPWVKIAFSSAIIGQKTCNINLHSHRKKAWCNSILGRRRTLITGSRLVRLRCSGAPPDLPHGVERFPEISQGFLTSLVHDAASKTQRVTSISR